MTASVDVGGAEVAVGVADGGGRRQREVGIVGRRDGEARQRPVRDLHRRGAGSGGEAVTVAVAERRADRDGADHQRGQRVGVAGEPVHRGRQRASVIAAPSVPGVLAARRQRRCQRIDGDHLGRARGGAGLPSASCAVAAMLSVKLASLVGVMVSPAGSSRERRPTYGRPWR